MGPSPVPPEGSVRIQGVGGPLVDTFAGLWSYMPACGRLGTQEGNTVPSMWNNPASIAPTSTHSQGRGSSGLGADRVSGVLVRLLADGAASHQVPTDLLFDGHAPWMTGDPLEQRVPLAQYRLLFQRAVELSGNAAFGLHCGLNVVSQAAHLIGPLIAHVVSLRGAIHELRQFQSLLFEGAVFLLSEHRDSAKLEVQIPRTGDEVPDQVVGEFAVSGLFRLFQAFGGNFNELKSVCFQHARPTHHPAYVEPFGGRQRFAAAFYGLEFAATRLDIPNIYHNDALHRVLHAQAEQHLARLTTPETTAQRVQQVLKSRPLDRVPGMEDVAQVLGVSIRTLRRRLQDENCSYRGLLQAAQCESACNMLRRPDLTMQQVGAAVGFAESSAFFRAFKRWTGMTPLEYRSAERSAEPASG